jgi:galactokinase
MILSYGFLEKSKTMKNLFSENFFLGKKESSSPIGTRTMSSSLTTILQFISQPRVFTAPARINIIGEHVDYLGGLVVPAAIGFQTRVAISILPEKRWELGSVQFQETLKVGSFSYQTEKKWANYILGVLEEFRLDGVDLPGLQIAIDGNIPQGAGLSSSASLEVGVGFAISELLGLGYSREKLALLGQRAENHFVGTKCGIMDQFIIATGKKDSCIVLNTATLEYSYREMHIGNCEFYLIDSRVKHSLDDGQYNQRREECESALKKLQKQFPDLKDLYSLPEDFQPLASLTPEELRRVRHVIGEKRRTMDALYFLESGRPEQLGRTLFETHLSLSNLFEVSCEETDFLVDQLRGEEVLGARMIGGGFGGCILVLDKMGNYERIGETIRSDYHGRYGIEPNFYKIQIVNGVHERIEE